MNHLQMNEFSRLAMSACGFGLYTSKLSSRFQPGSCELMYNLRPSLVCQKGWRHVASPKPHITPACFQQPTNYNISINDRAHSATEAEVCQSNSIYAQCSGFDKNLGFNAEPFLHNNNQKVSGCYTVDLGPRTAAAGPHFQRAANEWNIFC